MCECCNRVVRAKSCCRAPPTSARRREVFCFAAHLPISQAHFIAGGQLRAAYLRQDELRYPAIGAPHGRRPTVTPHLEYRGGREGHSVYEVGAPSIPGGGKGASP